MTWFNYVGIVIIAFGVYFALDRKPVKTIPDVPPTIEVGNWRVEHYMEKDESTIWRKIYKSGTLYETYIWWRQGQGILTTDQRVTGVNEVRQ